MTRKLRVGFIGAGGMAREHTKAMKGMDDVEIAAFTDVARERAEAMAEPFGAQVFDTPAQLCQQAGVDVVYILLPPFAHGDAECAAIAARIPFFVEKPVGLDAGLTRELAGEAGLDEGLGLVPADHTGGDDDPPARGHAVGIALGPRPAGGKKRLHFIMLRAITIRCTSLAPS